MIENGQCRKHVKIKYLYILSIPKLRMWLRQAIIGCKRFTYWLFKTGRHVPTTRRNSITSRRILISQRLEISLIAAVSSNLITSTCNYNQYFQLKSSKLLTYFILPCMTCRFVYSFKLPKRFTSQKGGWRLARINDQPWHEADHLPHPSPKINDESTHTLTRPAPYACMQHTVATLLLHAHTINRNQWNNSYIQALNIHKTVQSNHTNTACFSNVTTLISFRRGTTGKNIIIGITVLMPHGASLREY